MKTSPSESLNYQNTSVALNNIGSLCKRYGIEDSRLSLLLKWEDIKKAIEDNLTDEDKDYLWIYEHDRRGYTEKDQVRFSENVDFRTYELLKNDDNDMANQIAYFPPKLVEKMYGVAGLFFVWSNRYCTLGNSGAFKKLEEYINQNTELGRKERYPLILKSRETSWGLHKRRDFIACLANLDLFESLPGFLSKNRLPIEMEQDGFSLEICYSPGQMSRGRVSGWIERDFDKNGNNMESRIKKLYQLEEESENFRNYGKSIDWEGRIYNLYLDSPIGIMLKHEGKPIAIAGLSMKDESSIFVNQLQQTSYEVYDNHGRIVRKETSEISKKTNWQELLYRTIYEFSKSRGYRKLIIQGGENNLWTKKKQSVFDLDFFGGVTQTKIDVPHLSSKIAQKIYDTFAQMHGFSKGEDGNWEKDIQM